MEHRVLALWAMFGLILIEFDIELNLWGRLASEVGWEGIYNEPICLFLFLYAV